MYSKKPKSLKLIQRIQYATFGIDKLFFGIIILNLIGGWGFYKDRDSTVIIPIAIGLVGYLVGYLIPVKGRHIRIMLNRKKIVINSRAWDDTRVEHYAIWVLFILFFLAGFSLFIERGIPLFNAYNNELRSSFGDGTKGRIRALCAGLPMMSIYMFLVYQKTGKYFRSFLIMTITSIVGLAFYSYKAYILWFVIVMFYTYYYVRKSKGDDLKIFKWIVLGVFMVIGLIMLFSIWLAGNDNASTAFFNRIIYDQIDGFNYVYKSYVPYYGLMKGEFLKSELKNILFTVDTEGYTFMETLAYLFYGRQVTWGIVITLYGCFYIDFGNAGVFLGLALFGWLLKHISNYLNDMIHKKNINVVCTIMMITYMGYIFQNGSIVNEIRGTLLSILVVKLLYEVILLCCRDVVQRLNYM